MSQEADWAVEPPERGWLGRMIAPDGGPTSSLALGIGALAAAAFVASLALDWQRITIAPARGPVTPDEGSSVYTAGLGDLETLSLAYVLGSIGLFALLGAVATRPDLALRLRMTAMGAGVGLLGVLLAVTLRLTDAVLGTRGLFDAIFGGVTEELSQRMTTGYQPGIFFGYAAVVLSMISVWLAGRPAARAADAGSPDGWEGESDPRGAGRVERRRGRIASGPGDLSVTPAGPADLTVTPSGPVRPQ